MSNKRKTWMMDQLSERPELMEMTQISVRRALRKEIGVPLNTSRDWFRGKHDPNSQHDKAAVIEVLESLAEKQRAATVESPLHKKGTLLGSDIF